MIFFFCLSVNPPQPFSQLPCLPNEARSNTIHWPVIQLAQRLCLGMKEGQTELYKASDWWLQKNMFLRIIYQVV